MTSKRWLVLASLGLTGILVACMPVTGVPGSASANGAILPKVGDVETFIVRDGDREKQRLTYRAVAMDEIAPAGGTLPLAMVLESATGAAVAAPATASEAQVKAFLRDHWDQQVNGKDDAGQNGGELLQVLSENGLSVAQFIRLWEGSRLSPADFTRFWTVLDLALGDADHKQAVHDLRSTLDRYQLKLGDLLAVLANVSKGTASIPLPETAVTSFFQRLQSQKASLTMTFAEGMLAKKDLAAIVRDVQALKTQARADGAPVPNGYATAIGESYSPYWKVVSGNNATGTTGFFYIPNVSIMGTAYCTSYQTGLRTLSKASGDLVAQWRLYANGVCNPVGTWGSMSSATRIDEIGIKDLSLPNSRYQAYMSMGMGTNEYTHVVHSSVSILLAGILPLPVCQLDDFDNLTRESGFTSPTEIKLAYF